MLYYCIVPVRYTYLVEDEPRHLVIAQYLRKFPETMAFFKEQIKRGHEVILDNGAYEFGSPMEMDEYFKVIEELRPQIVVAPDAWKDSKKTIAVHDEFVRETIERGIDEDFVTMVVPQGKTIREYVECLYDMDITLGNIIGMSVGSWRDVSGVVRSFLAKHLDENPEPKIHLLGLWNASEILAGKENGRIRSVDTSMPFKLAKENQMLTAYSINADKMDFEMKLTGAQEELAKDNLTELRRIVEGL